MKQITVKITIHDYSRQLPHVTYNIFYLSLLNFKLHFQNLNILKEQYHLILFFHLLLTVDQIHYFGRILCCKQILKNSYYWLYHIKHYATSQTNEKKSAVYYYINDATNLHDIYYIFSYYLLNRNKISSNKKEIKITGKYWFI